MEKNKNTREQTVDVLYQRMGDKVYAFSLVGDEVFFGSINTDELSAQETGSAKVSRKMPEA